MDPNSTAWLLIIVILLFLIAAFFLPTIIAFIGRHEHRWWILLFNLALGGTGIGWFAALIWSLRLILGNSKNKAQI